MTRAQAKERNRRALLDAAREAVARDGHRARLDDIAGRAGLTTGAVYSLFGSKNALFIEMVADELAPYYDGFDAAVGAAPDLTGAVDAFARHYRRTCDAPDALPRLSFQLGLQDMALRDPDLHARLAASVRAQEERLTALFTGRRHGAATVTRAQAARLTTALRALLVGLSQGVTFGLAPAADEPFFAAAARALTAPDASSAAPDARPTPGRAPGGRLGVIAAGPGSPRGRDHGDQEASCAVPRPAPPAPPRSTPPPTPTWRCGPGPPAASRTRRSSWPTAPARPSRAATANAATGSRAPARSAAPSPGSPWAAWPGRCAPTSVRLP
ncbi:TetR/AcrR family transcriptional regulator, partial [Actinomadura sp. CNU-125]|uniref:TetR/AcrR family transcriptional regulator n=1 Tax=Actinomadura sp. CNU-125 TaxID=1904961 RepID=UPI00165221A0